MLDIKQILTVSLEHISEETEQKLKVEPDTDALGLSVYQKADFGYYINITDQIDCDRLPEDLRTFVLLTKDLKCDVLCLDCDAKIVPYLKTY